MLYALGSNGAGQLGLGHTQDTNKPERVLIEGNTPPWKVKQLAAGGSHTVILCEDGAVRATGDNSDGRCGLEGMNQLTHFTDAPLPLDTRTGGPIEIRQVAAGWECTFILSADGAVYVCGSGNRGELGLGEGVMRATSLQAIPSLGGPGPKVVYIAAGMGHAIAILDNGEAYGWGKDRNGQIGRPMSDSVWEPRRIDELKFQPGKAACGKDFTLLVGGEDARDLAILSGGSRGDKFGIVSSIPASIMDWSSATASWSSCYVVTSQGTVKAWGRGDHGQLIPHGLLSLGAKAIAAGSEHCLLLMDDGRVTAFGWGEHGNCGLPVDEQGDVKTWFNVLMADPLVTEVFAGCATSFIQTFDSESVHGGWKKRPCRYQSNMPCNCESQRTF